MIREGQMVRRAGGPPMRVLDVFNGMVRCVTFDGRGFIRQRFFYEDQLTPLWLSLQPRSLWPEAGNLDLIESEREYQAALEDRRKAKAAARKPRTSNKIRRGVAA